MSKAEQQHMDVVAQMACIARYCGVTPVHVHHAETGGGGTKDDMVVLPLCLNHHTGPAGIHTLGRKKWQEINGDEAELLARIARRCLCPTCKANREGEPHGN